MYICRAVFCSYFQPHVPYWLKLGQHTKNEPRFKNGTYEIVINFLHV
jgi:hypothetical protein